MINSQKQKSRQAGQGLPQSKISADPFYYNRHKKSKIELLASILDQAILISSVHPNRRCREKHAAIARATLERITELLDIEKMGPGVAV